MVNCLLVVNPPERQYDMAKAFHNLAGWLRDVRAALKAGEQLAYEVAEVLLELDDLITDPSSDTMLEDADEDSGEESNTDVALRDAANGGSIRGPASGHAPDGSPALGGPRGMGAAMERARELARAAAVQPGGPDALARARQRHPDVTDLTEVITTPPKVRS